MPTKRIPLVGVHDPRTIDGQATIVAGQDQRFVNCIFNVVSDPITGKSIAYLAKRPGWGVETIVSAGNISTGLIRTTSMDSVLSAFGDTNSTIYDSQVSLGTITGRALHFSETLISGVGYVVIKSSDGTGWYYPSNARAQTSYTGDTTNTSTTVNNIASTAGMYSGQAISGAGIPASTRIASVTSSSVIELDTAATATAAGVTLTKTPIAKILDADFITTGSFISKFVELDGFLTYCTDDGTLRNSDLNSVASYSALGQIAVQMSPDGAVAVARHKNAVICFGTESAETFRNAGNPSGSPMQRVADGTTKVGCLDQRSVTDIEDEIFFVTSSRDGDLMVKKLPGLVTVSTAAISRMLGTISNEAHIYLSAFSLGGTKYVSAYVTTGENAGSNELLLELGDFLLLEDGDNILLEQSSSVTAYFGRNFVYNVDHNIWCEWDSNIPSFVFGQGTGATNQLIAASRVNTGGKIYRINTSADGELHTDDGSTFTTTITTTKIDLGTGTTKFINAVRLIGDVQPAGTVTLSYSDNDYDSFTTAGTFDLTIRTPELRGLGSHDGGRVWRLEHSTDGAFRAQAIEIDYDFGTS